MVVFNYNPVSAVNYTSKKLKAHNSSSDSDISSSESRGSSPDRSTCDQHQLKLKSSFTKLLASMERRSSSNSNEDDDDDEDNDNDEIDIDEANEIGDKPVGVSSKKHLKSCNANNIDDVWANKSPEFQPATPTYIKSQFGKDLTAIKRKSKPPGINPEDAPLPDLPTRPIAPFSRSAVGGSKILMNCHPYNPDEYDGLEFESRFESGNLAKAVRITQTYYELYLRSDLYTSRSKQWFYFRVRQTRKNVIYRFSIVNLVKSDSLYNDGMRPLMYSTTNAKQAGEGWKRCGTNIAYYRNDDEAPTEEEDESSSYTLTFNIEFENDNDTVYFAHSYPYTYSDLQDYLMNIQKDPIKSKFCKLRLLCRSLAGNNVYYLTVTAPVTDEEAMKKKKAIVVSARVHPSETPASWMMKGLMDFITGDTLAAKRLRHRFIFKLIPMLNPDGVIVGNTRNSLTGKDLNRQYRTVIRETYPSIWYTKAMVKRLIDEYKVVLYCDMHAHSRKHNIFVYGCENKRNPEKKLTEQVFPLMLHKNVADKFSFESCKFKVQRSKEGTGRIVVWMLGITNSYTIEASFGGSSLGSRKGTHFNTADYEHMGRAFCETLLDYGDDTPNKERLRLKIIERLLKEGSNAEEPLNIPLSDYSSDEGGVSSSENECRGSSFSDLEGPCCALTRAPPSTPEAEAQHRRHRKPRARRSHSHHKRSDTRIALDLPTTDPSADLIFSTDEEPNTREDDNSLPQYCTVPRARARRLLQSELQRRYIEEIGDNVIGRDRTRMPPELIITSPSKGTAITIRPNVAPSQRLPDPLSALEFPVPFKSARRTNSWHNLNNGSLKPLSVVRQTSRPTNTYNVNESKLDELDLKLSLKKKYWTGVKADGSKESLGHARPLSWNQQMRCENQSGQRLKQITYERLTKPSCDKLEQQPLKKVEQEMFLNACSQKLIHWQKELSNRGKSMVTHGLSTSPTMARKIGIQMEALALGMPEIIRDERTLRIFRKVSQVTNELQVPTIDDTEILKNKSKRRSNALTKIADTSQLITRLAKTKSKTRYGYNQPTAARPSGVSLHKHIPGSNRFKAGGYVVTAVQHSSTKKLKKLHHNNKSQPSFGGSVGGVFKMDQKSNGGGGTMLSNTNLSIKSALSSNTFVRKVKAKLTKKKSNHPRDNPSNMTSNNRNLTNVSNIITNNSIYGVSLSRKM